ncbi:hypothetical protein XENTR_v10005415 [Xenopus tropicalis]|nr:hypothetical protein XENTR_v10005415 [Xenopus tropicalis]
MTCTIDKILQDAKTLLERLKDHDNAAESLIDQSSALHKRVEAMKEVGTAMPEKYQEELADIKDASKLKPHVLLCQENTQIRDLQQENKELWVSLEEHQYALELIMSKYRKQMLQLVANKKPAPTEPVLEAHKTFSSDLECQIDRICVMGDIMRDAIQLDEDKAYNIQEKLAQLEKTRSFGKSYPRVRNLYIQAKGNQSGTFLRKPNDSLSLLKEAKLPESRNSCCPAPNLWWQQSVKTLFFLSGCKTAPL